MNNSDDKKVTTKIFNEEKYYNLFDSEHENTPKIVLIADPDDHSAIEPEPPREATESNRSSLETIPIEEKKPSQIQDELIVANGKSHISFRHHLKSTMRFILFCQCFKKEEELLPDKHSSSDSAGPLKKEKKNWCPCLFSSKAKAALDISAARTEFDIVQESIIENNKQPKNT